MRRIFREVPLTPGGQISPSAEQTHYLLNVLRLRDGAEILVFNGRDGEWRAVLKVEGRKKASLALLRRERVQPETPDLKFCFALLRTGRLDYMVQKAVEMGAGVIQPVITRYTQISKSGDKRMRANIVEAAEQCGVLAVPELRPPLKFVELVKKWDKGRRLIFCDEACGTDNPLDRLSGIDPGPLGRIVGPEGGFSGDERQRLRALPFVTPIPLGPRILRADTAAVAALALVQATAGDW